MSDFWHRACYRIPFATAWVAWMAVARFDGPTILWLALLLAFPVLFIGGEIMGGRAVRRRLEREQRPLA